MGAQQGAPWELWIAFFGGLFIGFPLIATQIYRFVAPGLYAHERLRSTYNWTITDLGTAAPCTLYVVPTAFRLFEGDPVPTYTFKYYADAAHTQEITAPLVTSAPTCTSDYAPEMVIADSARTITCSGGDAGSSFVYDFTSTAQVRIGGPIVTLYVVPDNQNITEGDAVPASSFYTYTLHTGSSTGPTVSPTLATTPACTSTYAITMTNAVTPSINITCSGGSDPDYTFDTTSTATLTISIADSPTTLDLPTEGEAGTQVNENGLPAGSAAATNNELTSGTIAYTAPDGPASVTIDGVAITAVGQTFTGSFGTLTITSIANGVIGYDYLLTTNTSGNATFDDFAVVVTDKDGDSTPGTLTINIVDDVPSAANDADSIAAGQYGPATGNVITDTENDGGADVQGADGATVSAVAGAGGTAQGLPCCSLWSSHRAPPWPAGAWRPSCGRWCLGESPPPLP